MTEQLAAFERMTMSNPICATILLRMGELGFPDCYLAAGGLFQTVWNCLTGRDPGEGICDYDLIYFDVDDLSWDAEDRAIRTAKKVFADIDAVVEVRNEARVHLWYEDKFGVPCPPFTSTTDAIDKFAATTCCFGARLTDGSLEVYAPHGFSDLFTLVLRPNPVLAPREVYEAKATRWQHEWPQLKVLPWPEKQRPQPVG